jgi:cytochrome P450
LDYVFEYAMGKQSVPEDYVQTLQTVRDAAKKIIDVLRDLDRQGKLSEVQRKSPAIQLALETANDPDGGYERLIVLFLPLVIAGHETTGHTMSWAFYEMSRNPAIEKAVLDEIRAFQAAHAGRPITTADYDERPMAWALLVESLRRHTPVQSLPRTTDAEGVIPPDPDTGIGGFRYPADAMVVFSLVAVHLDPERWTDPLAFRLERWFTGTHDGMSLAEKGRAVRANIRAREQSMDWTPFSDGPGRCPGQHFNAHEFFIILDTLLPRFTFELVHSDEVHDSNAMVVGPETGKLGVRIRKRL